ncbi:MAG: DUF411 domain-containing protein [Thermodesulfobacteriota bacterium]
MQKKFYMLIFIVVSLFIFNTNIFASEIFVYKNPNCGCCNKWITHLEENSFTVKSENISNLNSIKEKLGVSKELGSCHTAVVEGYVIEGHVPVEDIRRLLDERPEITGLSVPEMPIGSPGMELGNKKEEYDVLAISKDGSTSVYSSYNNK